jgi:hypothetical protein
MTHSGTLENVDGTVSTESSNVKMNSFFMKIERVQRHNGQERRSRVGEDVQQLHYGYSLGCSPRIRVQSSQ